jgi:hypothetical protein
MSYTTRRRRKWRRRRRRGPEEFGAIPQCTHVSVGFARRAALAALLISFSFFSFYFLSFSNVVSSRD